MIVLLYCLRIICFSINWSETHGKALQNQKTQSAIYKKTTFDCRTTDILRF